MYVDRERIPIRKLFTHANSIRIMQYARACGRLYTSRESTGAFILYFYLIITSSDRYMRQSVPKCIDTSTFSRIFFYIFPSCNEIHYVDYA